MSVAAHSSLDISQTTLSRMGDLAERAAAEVMACYGRVDSVSAKADHSPLTEADLRAHRTIVKALHRWDPGLPIISEEGDIPDYSVRARWERFWLVDPLDGTKEFLARNGEFTINIALIDRAQPVLGVVCAPAVRTLYWAGRGLGSWRRIGTGPEERLYSMPARRAQPLRIVESRSHRDPRQEEFLATLSIASRVAVGSSLKFCRLAEGLADVYPRLSPIMEWDVAAGDCIFRCSGTPTERRSPLRYNRPDLRIPEFVIGI